jgi:hypothetical protein
VGQFVPAALDVYNSGELVPRSTIPNVHPPGVMLWLAMVWRLSGYSIEASRLAMLAIALFGCWAVYRLSCDYLCPDPRATCITLVLLCLSPLFFSQSIMVLLDMPARALTALVLWLFFGQRYAWSAAACMVLVMVKETGALLPAVLGIALLREHRLKQAMLFLLPGLPLLAWLLLLHSETGQWFGNASFAHYNLTYPLHPARLGMALLRRAYYLFAGSGYLIGSWILWRTRASACRSRPWSISIAFAGVHFAVMCLLGGAVLERYLLPILPLTLAAFANALCTLRPLWRNAAFAGMCACSALCIVVNPLYPFPLENNLSWTDYVEVQHDAATYLSTHLSPGATVVSAFPFAGGLRRPELGYTGSSFNIEELPDFSEASLKRSALHGVGALVIFSSTWDPLGVTAIPLWAEFQSRFYDFHPDVPPFRIPQLLGLHSVARFQRHGQWIEVFQP